jgi:hypothetical protein
VQLSDHHRYRHTLVLMLVGVIPAWPPGNSPPRVIMAERGAGMGDKGGKKDKEKNKQQQVKKQKQEEQRRQDKAKPRNP